MNISNFSIREDFLVALRSIRTKEDPILYKKCREVEKFDESLGVLINDMFETMRREGGVGLAAPQVGILKRIVVINVGDGDIELVNPIITESRGIQKGQEGCLSFPGEFGTTLRPMFVAVEGKNRKGEIVKYSGEGLKARAFCHEIDHLDGIVFKSRLV